VGRLLIGENRPFFEYSQNNSGGGFDYDTNDGISVLVIIEAPDAETADFKARRIGIYFDGIDAGVDCDCCGDRWYSAHGGGDPVPSHYGTPLPEANVTKWGKWAPEGTPEGYVHYADGRVEGFAAFSLQKRGH
jgi:hypothetical protein